MAFPFLLESGDEILLESGDELLLETISPARRVICEGVLFRPMQRPYQGGIGASLYVAAVDPNADPGPQAIEFRRNRTLDGTDFACRLTDDLFELGAPSLVKSPRVGYVETPDAEIRVPIPAEWHDQALWAQVRTFQDDYENETLYRPRRLLLDGSGEETGVILGTINVIAVKKRDGGAILVRIAYTTSRNGTQPAQFRLVKTAGAGTVPSVIAPYMAGTRLYEFLATGGTNGVAYTFRIDGENGAVVTTLASGIIATADSAGPPAVSNAVAVEV